MSPASLHDRLEGRRELRTVGKSGADLEEATLDGNRVIVKLIRHDDLLSEVLGGADRLALLWEAGALADLPDGVDHAMIGVEPVGDDWLVVQRDVSTWLVDTDRGIDAEQRSRLADGMARLHAGFTELDRVVDVGRLARVGDYLALMHPTRLAGYADDAFDGLIVGVRMGWEALSEVFPPDVAAAMEAIAAHPGGLATELERHQTTTFVHGDVFHANVAFEPERLVLLDWSQLLGWGTPVFDITQFLAYSGQLVEGGNDALLADYREASEHVGMPVTEVGVDLALLAALVASGWNKALVAVHSETAEERDRERAALEWWIAAARRALDHWAPS